MVEIGFGVFHFDRNAEGMHLTCLCLFALTTLRTQERNSPVTST